MKNAKNIAKILRGSFHLAHSLYIYSGYRNCPTTRRKNLFRLQLRNESHCRFPTYSDRQNYPGT